MKKRPILKNCIRAFFVGGLICVFGQFLLWLYQYEIKLDRAQAISLMSVTIVFISVVLTGLGIYDKIGQYAGVGTLVQLPDSLIQWLRQQLKVRVRVLF